MKEEKEASIWVESIYKNHFHCNRCGRKLLNERKGETTENLLIYKVKDQQQGVCICGNPAVVFRKHSYGNQVSANFEDQIRAEANEEIAHLLFECDKLTRENGQQKKTIETLESGYNSIKARLNELLSEITRIGIENGNLKYKLERKEEENKKLIRKLELLERKT